MSRQPGDEVLIFEDQVIPAGPPPRPRKNPNVWVPDRSSIGGDLGKFVDQSAEPVATSEAKAGW